MKCKKIHHTNQSNNKFRELLEHISSCVAVYEAVDGGEDFIFKDVNRALERIEKVRRRQILGKRVTKVFPGVREFGLFDVFKRVYKTGQSQHHPVTFYKDDRIQGWRQNHVYKLKTGEIVALYDDLTQQKQIEEALLRSEERYRSTLHSLDDAIHVVDKKLRILLVNKKLLAWTKELGIAVKSSIIGKSIFEAFFFLPRKVREEYKKVFTTGLIVVTEESVRLNGREILTDVRKIPVFEDDKVTKVITVIRDITQRKRQDEKLKEREQILSTIVENSADVFYVHDRNNFFTYVSPQAKEVLGMDDKSMHINWQHLLTDNPINKIGVALSKRALQTGERQRPYLLEIEKEKGKRRIMLVHESPVKDEKGEAIGLSGALKDITEQQSAEEQLGIFKKFADTAGQGFGFATLEGEIIYANNALARFLGRSPKKAMGTFVFEYYLPQELKMLKNKVLPTVLEHGQWIGELSIVSCKKTVTPTIQNVFLVKDEEAKPLFFANVLTDISEQKKTEKILRKSGQELKDAKDKIELWNEQLEKKVKERTQELKESQAQLFQAAKLSAIGQLSAGVAHELNSPLAGLLSLIRSYRRNVKEGSRQYKDLTLMLNASEHMAKVVSDLTSFARGPKQEIKEVDINKIIEATINFAMYQIARNKIILLKDLAEDVYPVRGDSNQLQQVILNILANACDAMPKGGRLTVRTRADQKKRRIQIECIDTGVGIAKEDLPMIFDPFFTTKKVGEGTGLGLSVSHGIIKNHKGNIAIKSRLGKGTQAIVTLPAARK